MFISAFIISCGEDNSKGLKKLDNNEAVVNEGSKEKSINPTGRLKENSSDPNGEQIPPTQESKVNESEKFDVENVISKHLSSIGMDKLLKINDMTLKGKIIQQGIASPFKKILKRPLKSYFETIIQDKKWVNAFDGKNGWYVNPTLDNIPKEATGPTLDLLKEQSDMDGLMYNWKNKFYSVTDLGTANESGKSYFVILVTKKDGSTMKIFIDTATMLLHKVTTNVNNNNYTGMTETIFSNYRKVNGVNMAYKIEFMLNGQKQTEYLYEIIKFNTNPSDLLFSMPVN